MNSVLGVNWVRSNLLTKLGIFFVVFASALNFRLRLVGDGVHIGGAEFALAPYDVVCFFVVPFLLIKYWDGRVRGYRDAINVSIFFFVFFSCFSFANSVEPKFTAYEAFRHIKVALLFLVFRRVFAKTDAVVGLVYAALALVFFELLISLTQLGAGEAEVTEDAAEVKEVFVEGGLVRVSGTLRHPNLLGLYLNLLLPFMVVGALHFRRAYVFYAAIVLVFFVLLMTYSRTQLALYGVILFFAFLTFKTRAGRGLYRSKLAWGAIGTLSLILLGAIAVNFDDLYERFFNAPESSSSSRLVLAEIALEMALSHPFVGIGWNTFIYAMADYDLYKAAAAFQYPVHNMYLLILSETGLVGLLSFFALLWSMYKAYRFSRLRFKLASDSNVVQASFISLVVILITGMQGWSFRADSIQFLVWVCYAIIAGMYDKARSLSK